MNRDGHNHDKLDRILDQALDEIRAETLDPQTADGASERVWQRIAEEAASSAESEPARQEPLQRCDDFQALIPAFITDSLSDARRMLLEDHVRDCLACRKAVKQARGGRVAAPVRRSGGRRSRRGDWSWAVAAAALVALALIGFNLDLGLLSVRAGGMITVTQVDGALYRVSEAGAIPISAGDTFQLGPDEGIRTAKGSHAIVELADGSELEMRERSQLAVYERNSRFSGERIDQTIDLDRGAVIVEASDQGSGQLYVETPDKARVTVTGTVFAVNSGVKGTRVSVFEGAVEVKHDGRTDRLAPGDQVGTSPSVGAVPLDREIEWSKRAEEHLALLALFTELGKDLDAMLEQGRLRHSTRLLDRAPAGTMVYAALPNISGALADAYDEMQARIADNPILADWWTGNFAGDATGEMDQVFRRIRDYGAQLGGEVVLTLQVDANRDPAPLILAEIERPAEFVELLVGDLEETHDGGEMPSLRVFEGLPPIVTLDTNSARKGDVFVWIHDGVVAVTPDEWLMHVSATITARPELNLFQASSFHTRLSDLYRDGVEWLVGVDIGGMMQLERKPGGEEDETLAQLGLLDLEHLILERRPEGEKFVNRAVLSFDQARRGIAAWLAEPAPMGSLEFISPDASLVGAFVMKTPTSLIEELLSTAGADATEALDRFRAEVGVDLREDIAAALGGEFAFALDGPVLPKPSWKFALEVYDESRLQRALETIVERINEEIARHGSSDRKNVALRTSDHRGRTFHELQVFGGAISAVHFTYVDGYLLAGPSRVLLERSIANRASGFTFGTSPRFQALMPNDGRIHFSAIAYQNLGQTFGNLLRQLRGMAGSLEPEQRALVDSVLRTDTATLTYAYGDRDRITVAATTNEGLFSTGIKTLFNLKGLLDVHDMVSRNAGSGS